MDGDLAGAFRQALAGAKEERHVGPSPVVDENSQRDVRLGGGVRRDALLGSIASDRRADVEAGGVLRANDVGVHALAFDPSERSKNVELLVADHVGFERTRRFHRDEREELKHVVLNHVSKRAGLFVIPGARADTFFLRDRNLHMVHVFLVEQRLEDAVRKPQDQDVLDGFLSEVVVDPVDLPLVEHRGNRVVDRPGAFQIATDWLLDDQARERALRRAVDEARASELFDRGTEQRRRHRQVVHAISGQPALVLDRVEPRAEPGKAVVLAYRRRNKKQRRREIVPCLRIERPARKSTDSVLRELAIRIVIEARPSDSNNRHARGKQPVEIEVVERGQELAMRQIAGAAEDHERDGIDGDDLRFSRSEPLGDRHHASTIQ